MTAVGIDEQEDAGISPLERGLRGVFTCRGLGIHVGWDQQCWSELGNNIPLCPLQRGITSRE